MTQERNVFIKLVNGDMLVATLLSDPDNGGDFELKHAHLIVPSSETSIGFINYNPYGKSDTITLEDGDVLFYDDMVEEIEEGFTKLTNPSSLIIPDTKIIT